MERYARNIRYKERPTIFFNGTVGILKEIDEENAKVLIKYKNQILKLIIT